MNAIAEKLDQRLSVWGSDLATEVEKVIEDIIDRADSNSLDILRSREAEQEVLDIIDER